MFGGSTVNVSSTTYFIARSCRSCVGLAYQLLPVLMEGIELMLMLSLSLLAEEVQVCVCCVLQSDC